MAYSLEQRTQAVATVIAGLRQGTPLTVLCAADDMPGVSTFYEWMDADPNLSGAIARAREVGFDAIAHRARQTVRGKGPNEGGDSSGDWQRDKLIAEYDLKLLSKWDPKRYGEMIKHAGADGGALAITVASEDAAL